MPEIQVILTSVEMVPGKFGKSNYKVAYAGGNDTIFSNVPGVALLAQGKQVTLVKEQKGAYLNVVEVKGTPFCPDNSRQTAAEQAAVCPPKPAPVRLGEPIEKIRSMSFAYAKDAAVGGVINPVMTFRAAKCIETFVLTGQEPAGNDWVSCMVESKSVPHKAPKLNPDAVPV